MNIIFDEDCTLRVTKTVQSESYELSNINFFISNKFNSCNAFVVLINSAGLADIIPLNFADNSNLYKKYKITYSNSIRVNSGKFEIKMILVDSNSNEIFVSTGDKLFCNINIDNYKIARQVAITNELNLSIKELYDKIRKLTDMNIDIYEKIMERGK